MKRGAFHDAIATDGKDLPLRSRAPSRARRGCRGRGRRTTGVFEALRQLNPFPDISDGDEPTPPTVEDILDTLEARLRRKLAGDASHPVWVGLAERLEALRSTKIDSAAPSVEFLKQLLALAKDLVEADKVNEVGPLDDIKVVDPDKGALTQILAEHAPPDVPVIIETVVEKIDAIVRPVPGTGWQKSQAGDREVRQRSASSSRTAASHRKARSSTVPTPTSAGTTD